MLSIDLMPLLRACEGDYDPDQAGTRWGNDFATVTHKDGMAVVAFRGTDNLGGWITDAEMKPALLSPWPVPVHNGFADAMVTGATKIFAQLSKDEFIILTGHSRGGALATLFAWVASQRGFLIERIVTFGEPRSIAGELAWPFDHVRVIHDHDPVPFVPPAGLGYRHVGQELRISDRDWMSRTWGSVCRLLGLVPNESISDHPIAAYARAVQMSSGDLS
jgi:pimeloyl-ACP methyl ester carboxylesterase